MKTEDKNILVVDDSESMRELIGSTLEMNGFKIAKGENGKEGVERLKDHQKFDLIITDLNMPVMDGITFLKEIRSRADYRYVPVLILTTESNVEMRNEAKASGATGWIVKPFDGDKLINVIRKVIR